jgi:hypothetical protein
MVAIHTSTARNRHFVHFVTIVRSPRSSVVKRPFGDIFRRIAPIGLNIAPPTVDIQMGFPYIITPQNPVVGPLLLRVVLVLAILASSSVWHEEQLVEMRICYLVACPMLTEDIRRVLGSVDPVEVHPHTTCSNGLTNLVVGECNVHLAQL